MTDLILFISSQVLRRLNCYEMLWLHTGKVLRGACRVIYPKNYFIMRIMSI